MAHSSRTLMGTITRIAGAIAALVLAFVAFIAPASNAEESASVSVSNATLERADVNGNRLEGGIRQGDVVAFTFDWAGQQLRSGDSISVTLPGYLSSLEPSHSQRLTFSGNGTTTAIGDCSFEERAFTCAFDKGIDAMRAQGFDNPGGKITVLLKATKATTSAAAQFTINGEKIAAQIPGGSVSSAAQASYEPLDFSMASGDLTSASQVVPWTVNFGSTHVAQGLAASGTAMPLDGTSESSFTIVCQLGPGQSFSTKKDAWVLSRTTSAQDSSSAQRTLLTDSSGRDHTSEHGDFDLSVEVEADQARVTVTGPWEPETNYALNYAADVEAVSPGVAYTSSAAVEGTSLASDSSRTYTNPLTSTVSFQPGFGGFEIDGAVTGGQASEASGAVVPVTLEYALPGGATAASYPGWQAPGSLAVSGTGGVVTVDVPVGQTASFPSSFPVGTQIRLSVDASSSASSSVRWQGAEFTVEEQATSKLTISSQTTASVTVTARVAGGGQSQQATASAGSQSQATSQQAGSDSAASTAAPESTQQAEAGSTDEAATQAPAAAGDATAGEETSAQDPASEEDGTSGGETSGDGTPAGDGDDRIAYSPGSSESHSGQEATQPDGNADAAEQSEETGQAEEQSDEERIPLSPGGDANQGGQASDAQTADGGGSGNSGQSDSGSGSDSGSVSGSGSAADSGSGASSGSDASNASDSGQAASQQAQANQAAGASSADAGSTDASGATAAESSDAGSSTALPQLEELSAAEALGIESEEDFLLRTEEFPLSDATSRRGSSTDDSDVELDLKPLPTVRSKANDGRILSTGMGISAGVISALVLGLLGSALVVRRYFN